METSRGPKRGWWVSLTYADEGGVPSPNATTVTVYT